MTSFPSQIYPAGYLDHFSGDRLVAVASVFITAEIIFVALSFVASYVSQRKSLKWRFRREEWFTVLGLGSNLAMNAISLAAIKYVYAGHHLPYILTQHPTTLPTFLKMEITFAILYILSITLPKLTMLSLFLRIFVIKWQRRASYLIAAILLATALANIIANVTQCIPLDHLWDKQGKGKCFDQDAYWRWASSPNILTDVAMLALPVPMIMGTMMGWRDKAGVGITFLAGSLGLITSILRFAAFWRMQPASDITWTAIELCAYSIAEGGVYLIASCLPAYRALYLTITRPHPWPSTARYSGTGFASGDWGVITGSSRSRNPSICHETSHDETSPETAMGSEIQAPRSVKGNPRTYIQTPSPTRSKIPFAECGQGHAHAYGNGNGDLSQLFYPWPMTRRRSSLRRGTGTRTENENKNQDNEHGIIIQQDFSIEYEDLRPMGNHIGYQYAGDIESAAPGPGPGPGLKAKT
ncbi:hypothetical protein OCU04_009378 [Sclerotinia nivalis]|uniref:Rhodopsin domain-containing protein n=1 Tax=Sclerotinia nivalis TaxID=352851 RepID=A0A9X0AEW6_9HELO|nr:hypothetical protein OCU04_009378 [Sclerotinia nivalis]